MMNLIKRLERSKSFLFLIISSFIFFLLRLPSLFEPYWYGDEGIYQVIGIALRNGRLLYRDIWDNKPPLLYLIYAFFNGDQFWARLFSLTIGIFTVIAFYVLSARLFENKKKAVFWSTGIFTVLFGLPLIEGNIANAENFMLFPIILAGILVFKNTNKQLLSGFLVSLAFLTKIVALFDFAAFFLFLLFINAPLDLKITVSNLKREIKKLLPFMLGFTAPIILTALFFLFKGAIKDFFQASFIQNVGYVGYGNKFIIPQGFLILKLIILGAFVLFIFLRRSKITKSALFIFLWFAFSLFDSFFSQRPYTHYVLMMLPSFCLLTGLIFADKKSSKFAAALAIVTLILVINNFWFYGKTIYYYQNFISFITSNKSVNSYRSFFDQKTPRDYQLVQFITSHANANDNIFIWGNNAQVYALSGKLPPGRYAVAYHITGYKDGNDNTINGIKKENPKYIILMPDVGNIPFPLTGFKEKANIQNVIIYERLF